jgi:hypothetical protein
MLSRNRTTVTTVIPRSGFIVALIERRFTPDTDEIFENLRNGCSLYPPDTIYAGGVLPGPWPPSEGTLEIWTPDVRVVSDVLVALLSASYTFFAYVVLGSQQSENTVLPFGDVNPTGHDVQDEAPLSEYVFSRHVTHVAVPDAFLNFPASHAGHGPPFGPVYPGLQEQWLTLVLPTDEFEFAGQLVHGALPFVGLYVPVPHIVHWPLEAPRSGPV